LATIAAVVAFVAIVYGMPARARASLKGFEIDTDDPKGRPKGKQ
jgi:hypothetical protein